jgi:hypothetical protein
VQREQPFGAGGRAARRAADELVERGVERQRARLHLFAQRRPRRKSVLASDHRLGIVQGETRCGTLVNGPAGVRRQSSKPLERGRVAILRGAKQRLGLLLQLFEIRAGWQLARRHTTSMLQPVVRKQAARRRTCRDRKRMTVGLALRANPPAPFLRSPRVNQLCRRVSTPARTT